MDDKDRVIFREELIRKLAKALTNGSTENLVHIADQLDVEVDYLGDDMFKVKKAPADFASL